mmetsp:Transcript_66428/g.160364  ORF Transcript_66428/g.160364 Transcript_66428/m.160364 type:complete len:145 (+) Transcript_66428:126-560(+)
MVAPINVNGLSVKVAKGEAATIMAETVLGNMELLSTVIKYALESNAQAPTLASVAQAWHEQLCFWKQQLVLKTPLCKELKAGVQCLDCSPLVLLRVCGGGGRDGSKAAAAARAGLRGAPRGRAAAGRAPGQRDGRVPRHRRERL